MVSELWILHHWGFEHVIGVHVCGPFPDLLLFFWRATGGQDYIKVSPGPLYNGEGLTQSQGLRFGSYW